MPTRRSTTTASRRARCATPSGATAAGSVRVIATSARRPAGRPRADARDLPPRHAARRLPHRDQPRRRPDGERRALRRALARRRGLDRRAHRRQRLRRHARVRRARAGPRSPTSCALDTTNAAEVRLAHFYDGAWHIETLARTTYRQAASEANASSVGLALDRYLALKVAYIDPASHSVRLVGEDARPQRFGTVPATAARATIAFGANGEVGVVCAGLAGEDARLWVATGRLGGATPHVPRDGPVGQLGRDRRLLARRADRRLPRPPRRLRGGARRAQVPQLADRARLALQPEQPVQRRLRRGALEPRRHRRRAGRERRPARVRRDARSSPRARNGVPKA